MTRLVSISDLGTLGWQGLLPHVAWLADAYVSFKAQDNARRVLKIHMGGDNERAHGIHASEISSCLKKVVYSLKNTQQKEDAETASVNMKQRFQQGTLLHALIQDDFEIIANATQGLLTFEPEVSIKPGNNELAKKYEIQSHCDGVFTFNAGGNPFLRVGLEIKTASDKEYDKLTKPQAYHVDQAHIYMKALDLPLMWFLYYNKSNSNWTPPMAPFLMTFDQNVWNRLEFRAQQAHKLKQENTLPKGEEGFHCKWCQFSWTCRPKYLAMSGNKKPSLMKPMS